MNVYIGDLHTEIRCLIHFNVYNTCTHITLLNHQGTERAVIICGVKYNLRSFRILNLVVRMI